MVLVRTWYLFHEVAAEELQGSLGPAKNSRKEEVKTKYNSHINLKVAGQDRSVVLFKRHTPLSPLINVSCARQRLPVSSSDPSLIGGQVTKDIHLHSWK